MVAESGRAPDIIVIGAGIAGLSAAAELAARGLTVTVLEREAIGAGASGRNSGVVQHPFDRHLAGLYRETVACYRMLAQEDEAFAFGAAPVGMLCVTERSGSAIALAAAWARTYPDVDAEALEPDDARRREPGLAADVSACYLRIGYPIGPADATRALARRAGRLGVTIDVGTGARPEVVASRAIGVVTDDGRRLRAGNVVVAAGPWSSGLVDPAGRWRPIQAVWGAVLTVTLPDPPHHVLEEADIEIEPPSTDAPDATDTPSMDVAFSLVTVGADSSLGSTFLLEAPDAEAVVEPLIRRGARFLPAIAEARRGSVRICARPVSLDGRPLVGAVPDVEGVWIVAGHGPWGISTGPATGRLLADLMTDREPAPPRWLDPARFGP